jgi:hypothetical protein
MEPKMTENSLLEKKSRIAAGVDWGGFLRMALVGKYRELSWKMSRR